jgi:opacity protein-like surface antigen
MKNHFQLKKLSCQHPKKILIILVIMLTKGKEVIMMLKTTMLFSTLTMFCFPLYGADAAAQEPNESEKVVVASEETEITFCRPPEAKPACPKPKPPKKPKCCEEKSKRHGVYLSGSGGANFARKEAIADAETRLRTGYVFTAAAGYLFKFGLRIEAEAAYRRNKIYHRDSHLFDMELSQPAKGHFQSMSYMMNFLYDIPTNFWIVPYFGGGAGCAYNRHHYKVEDLGSVFHSEQHKNGFAWQGIGGLAFVIGHFDITLEYRYYKPNVKKYNDQNVLLGLRYHF